MKFWPDIPAAGARRRCTREGCKPTARTTVARRVMPLRHRRVVPPTVGAMLETGAGHSQARPSSDVPGADAGASAGQLRRQLRLRQGMEPGAACRPPDAVVQVLRDSDDDPDDGGSGEVVLHGGGGQRSQRQPGAGHGGKRWRWRPAPAAVVVVAAVMEVAAVVVVVAGTLSCSL
jgi:hypothetical protein